MPEVQCTPKVQRLMSISTGARAYAYGHLEDSHSYEGSQITTICIIPVAST